MEKSSRAAGSKGSALRAEIGSKLVEVNAVQFACIGLNYGTHYDQSPIISYDEGAAPAYNLGTYTPSTVPGCRAPHLWLKDGSSLYDKAGDDFVLIRSDPGVDVGALVAAAADRGLPLKVIDIAGAVGAEVYDHAIVLMRPDQHVGWRANQVPDDAYAVVDTVRGADRRSLVAPRQWSSR